MTRKDCPNKKDNENVCPCPFVNCPRHGVCCDCIQFHKTIGIPPACITGFREGFTENEIRDIAKAEGFEEE